MQQKILFLKNIEENFRIKKQNTRERTLSGVYICKISSRYLENDRVLVRHVPRSQKDPRSWISKIQDPGFCGILDIIFSFSHGILKILDLVMAMLPWDPRDLGSRTEKIMLDPGDPGSS